MAGEKPDVLLIGPKEAGHGQRPRTEGHAALPGRCEGSGRVPQVDRRQGARHRHGLYRRTRSTPPSCRSCPSSSRFRASASATTTSTPNGRARTASSSPTRRKCSTRRSPTPRSACCSARCANSRRPNAFCAPANGPEKQYPLTKATLRNRTVGMVGMGRIGKAIARRLEAFGVPVVYHSRNPQKGVSYKYYPKLLDMARDVDTLLVIVPGGAGDRQHDQRRGAQGARAERHPHQHGARLGGGRAGADRGA